MSYLPNLYRNTIRESIPKTIRNAFKTYTDLIKPVCPMCGERILRHEEMQIGHIVSCFHDGNSKVDNLIALHTHCNVGTDNIVNIVDNYPENIKSKFLIFKRR